ncbi:MAG: hypothetical protein ACK2U9_04970, partial [Anaerolineae bacterium]
VSFMVAAPISSLLLGFLIEWTTPLFALTPGIAMSFLIFVVGLAKSGLWQYQSGSIHPAPGS